jgi:hypothetical protein
LVRPLGLGPLRVDSALAAGNRVVVRQASALAVGAFLDLVALAMGFGILYDPGKTVGSGNAFIDRWFFGILVVPILWGADRFLLRPRVSVDEVGVELHNPVRTVSATWPAVVGAGFDRQLRLVTADGDMVSSILFGPALSSPLTSRARVDELVQLIDVEAARRAGRTYEPDPTYSAQDLVGSIGSPVKAPTGPGATFRNAPGWLNLAGYAAAWTLSCILAAAAA